MTVTVYSSTDTSAPTLNNLKGSLVALLDAVLVNGYGTQSAAGWSIAYTASSGRVYRQGTGNQYYLRVDDTYPGSASQPGYALVNGLTTTTGYAYGVNAQNIWPSNQSSQITMPTVAIVSSTITPTNQFVIAGDFTDALPAGRPFVVAGTVSNNGTYTVSTSTYSSPNTTITTTTAVTATAGAVGTIAIYSGIPGMIWQRTYNVTANVAWTIIATSKAFYLWINMDNGSAPYLASQLYFFGDITSFRTSDAFATLLCGSMATNTVTAAACPMVTITNSIATAIPGHYMAKSFTQIGTAINVGKHSDNIRNSSGFFGRGSLTYPNLMDGRATLAPIWIHEPNIGAGAIRGYMPGIWNHCHLTPFAHGDTFSGASSGLLAGKTFMVFNMANTTTALSQGQCAIETSNTW